jgi:hypothetical protein
VALLVPNSQQLSYQATHNVACWSDSVYSKTMRHYFNMLSVCSASSPKCDSTRNYQRLLCTNFHGSISSRFHCPVCLSSCMVYLNCWKGNQSSLPRQCRVVTQFLPVSAQELTRPCLPLPCPPAMSTHMGVLSSAWCPGGRTTAKPFCG